MSIAETLRDFSHESALGKAEKQSLREIAVEWEQLQAENKRLEVELADVKLELSTPLTAGMEKEPLYKWAASIVCEGHRLVAENKRLKEILAREVDDGRAEVDDIGVEAWIEQALKAE